MRLAIADAEPITGDVLAFAAHRRGHQVVCVADVDRLFNRLPFEPAAVVVALDSEAAGGPALVGRLRDRFPDQVLLVTVEGPRDPWAREIIRAGADDVIRVPYNPAEVVAKAEAGVTRKPSEAKGGVLEVADIEIMLDRYTARKNGRSLTMTKLELRLLYCLVEHHPHLAPIDRLLAFGWDSLGDPDPTLIKTHISHIRKKLADAGGVQVDIASRQTLGYVLSVS